MLVEDNLPSPTAKALNHNGASHRVPAKLQQTTADTSFAKTSKLNNVLTKIASSQKNLKSLVGTMTRNRPVGHPLAAGTLSDFARSDTSQLDSKPETTQFGAVQRDQNESAPVQLSRKNSTVVQQNRSVVESKMIPANSPEKEDERENCQKDQGVFKGATTSMQINIQQKTKNALREIADRQIKTVRKFPSYDRRQSPRSTPNAGSKTPVEQGSVSSNFKEEESPIPRQRNRGSTNYDRLNNTAIMNYRREEQEKSPASVVVSKNNDTETKAFPNLNNNSKVLNNVSANSTPASPLPHSRASASNPETVRQKPSVSSAMRKSYLDFDIRNFKRTYNGTLVRIQPQNIEQQVAAKLQETKMKSNEAIILSLPQKSNNKLLNHIINNQSDLVQALQPKNEPASANFQNYYNSSSQSYTQRNSPLADMSEELAIKYYNEHGIIDSTSSANMIYDYFTKFAELARVKFESPLIKKYKNCVYFGDNPNLNPGTYSGFIYHYNVRLYYGQFQNGKKHGKGCEISFKENTICRGVFDSGSKVGVFSIKKPQEFEYEGSIVNGLFEGKGTLITKTSRYEGNFSGGYKHGQGVEEFFITGQRYAGKYKQGKFDGLGEFSTKEYYYEGMWKDSLKEGDGYEKTPGEEYRGSFVAGKRQGQGTLYLANGDLYKGEFKDGHIYGKGEYKSASSNQTAEGYFVNGRLVSEKPSFSNLMPAKNNKIVMRKGAQSPSFMQDPRPPTQQLSHHSPYHPPNQKLFQIEETIGEDQFLQNQMIRPPMIFNPDKLAQFVTGSDQVQPTHGPVYSHSSANQTPRKLLVGGSHEPNTVAHHTRRGSDRQQVRYFSNQRNGREQINSSRGYNPMPAVKTVNNNNFMQLDYSLFDNSVDEEVPAFPSIQQKRLKSGHTEDPIVKRVFC